MKARIDSFWLTVIFLVRGVVCSCLSRKIKHCRGLGIRTVNGTIRQRLKNKQTVLWGNRPSK